jgi:hypothetical protein
MNTFRIVRLEHGFQTIEVTSDGHDVTRQFQSEAIAQVWVVQRASAANLADLAQWLRGANETIR